MTRGFVEGTQLTDASCDQIRHRVLLIALHHSCGQHEHCHSCTEELAAVCPAAAKHGCAACIHQDGETTPGTTVGDSAEQQEQVTDPVLQELEAAEKAEHAAADAAAKEPYLGKSGDMPKTVQAKVWVAYAEGVEIDADEARAIVQAQRKAGTQRRAAERKAEKKRKAAEKPANQPRKKQRGRGRNAHTAVHVDTEDVHVDGDCEMPPAGGDAGAGCSKDPVQEAAVVAPQVTISWAQENLEVDTADALFKFLSKFMTNDHIRKMQGGLTTNMNECGNGVIASVGVEKKNGAAACSSPSCVSLLLLPSTAMQVLIKLSCAL